MTDPLSRCFSEAKLNGLTLRNRVVKAATFEGKTPGGVPSKALVDFHVRLGEGGIGMTTIGYCAPEPDGRIHEHMLCMDEPVREPLGALVRAVQATGAKVSGQLTHCGIFSKNAALRAKRPLGPSFALNELGVAAGLPFGAAMSEAQIRERVAAFGRAAAFMKSVGFDAIEIHFGHGYGLSQFISPKTNRRTDAYGGSLANRMRMPLEVLASVRENVGDDYPILGRISMTDGVPGGVTYDEGVEVAALLDAGGIDAIICSGGTSSMNPMLLFRGDSIAPGLIAQEKNPLLKLGMKLVEKSFFKAYPYEPLYFLDESRRVRDRVRCAVCYVGGACSSDDLRTLMREGFDFVHVGRAALYDPDFARNAADDPDYRNGCTHCNQCATRIEAEGGIVCVLREAPAGALAAGAPTPAR